MSALVPARPFVLGSVAAVTLAAALSPTAYAVGGAPGATGGPPGPAVHALAEAGSAAEPDTPEKAKPDKDKPDKPDKQKHRHKHKQKDRGQDSAVGKPPKSETKSKSKSKSKSTSDDGSSSAVGKPPKSKTDTKTKTKTSGDDDGNDVVDPTATNGGHALAGDAGITLAKLTPTAPPTTAYEMPFPCGEVWTGSTRAGHSPSIRAVDFNYAGGDLGKPVLAAASGTVVTAVVGKNKPSYGQYVVIDHGNGESSLYAHMDSVLVTVGQTVSMGTQIGTVGETGNADGSHLHFEERLNGAVIDAWFHGAVFPMNSSAASQNCGGTPLANPVASTDIPLAGDMYGGKAAELMVYRRTAAPASYFVDRRTKEKQVKIGDSTSQPVVGDWDGNGKVNPGVREPSTRVFTLKVRRKVTTIRFGKKNDTPVAGNWDGQGGWEIGVWRPGSAKFLLRAADGSKTKVALGTPTSLPVTGDWNGDGITDLGVYDQTTATYTLLTRGTASATPTTVQFGTPGDVPVVGDWNGDGVTELGSWNPYTTVFAKRGVDQPAGGAVVHKVAMP